MENNQLDRREYTKNLVSGIKDKISEFKNKKAHEKKERKNELDFEINKDLVNQFKKNKNADLISNEEISDSTPLKSKQKIQNIQQAQQELTSNKTNTNSNISPLTKQQDACQINQIKLNQKEQSLSITPNENPETIKKNNLNSKTQELMNTLLNKMNNSNLNQVSSLNSGNKGNNYNNVFSNNSNSDPYSLPIKKDISKGIPKYSNGTITHDNNFAPSTKIKMRNFIEQLDEPRRIMSIKDNNHKLIPLPTYTGPTHIKHNNINSINKGIDKKKDLFSIEAFGDFNYKSHNNSSIINNTNTIDKSKGFSVKSKPNTPNAMIEPVYRSSIQMKQEFPIKTTEIRAIANKIRFLSGEEAKGLDKNIVDELSNLKDVVNRLFESKLKVKEYKYY